MDFHCDDNHCPEEGSNQVQKQLDIQEAFAFMMLEFLEEDSCKTSAQLVVNLLCTNDELGSISFAIATYSTSSHCHFSVMNHLCSPFQKIAASNCSCYGLVEGNVLNLKRDAMKNAELAAYSGLP